MASRNPNLNTPAALRLQIARAVERLSRVRKNDKRTNEQVLDVLANYIEHARWVCRQYTASGGQRRPTLRVVP
jgi:hypothetical protein